jgi:hypothetical protein
MRNALLAVDIESKQIIVGAKATGEIIATGLFLTWRGRQL